jgi:hypothetical protein
MERQEDGRKVQNKELHNLYYSSQNVIRMIKSKKMSWAEHTARMGKMGNVTIPPRKPRCR